MTPALRRWLTALGDPALLACAGLAVALVLVPRDWLGGRPTDLLHLAALAITVLALDRRRRAAASMGAAASEGLFWRDLIAALAIWTAVDVAQVIALATAWPELAVASRSLGGAAWLAVWLAAAEQPHRRGHWRPRRVERRLHTAGAAVFALGSIAYVVAPPARIYGFESALRPTWLLLSVFAALVVGRLVVLVLGARGGRWRGVYGALGLAAAVVGWSHVESLLGPEPAASAALGGPWVGLALTLLVAAARCDQLHADDETGETLGDPIEEGPRHLEAPYLALAIGVPLAHYAAVRAGWTEPALTRPREQIMLAFMAALAAVSVYQQRRLERWVRRTLDERGRLERSLQASRRRLQLMDEKRLTAEALRREREIYTKAFDGSPWGVLLTARRDGRHLECNDRYLQIVGFERDRVIGASTLELGIWPVAAEREAMIEELGRRGSVRAREITFRRHDGDERPALVSAEPLELDGEACLLSVVRDLSDLGDRPRRRRAVGQIIEGLPHGLWRLDLHDRVASANPAAERVAGSLDDQRGVALPTLPRIPDAARWRRALRSAIEEGFFDGPLPIAVDGGRREAAALIVLVRDRLGLPNGKLLALRLEI